MLFFKLSFFKKQLAIIILFLPSIPSGLLLLVVVIFPLFNIDEVFESISLFKS